MKTAMILRIALLLSIPSLLFAGADRVEKLISQLKDERVSIHARRSAAFNLGQLRDERAVEPLIAVLQDKDRTLNRFAARSLGDIGDRRAVEPLIAVLQNKDDNLSMWATESLGKIGDRRAVEPLIKAVEGKPPSGTNREKAIRALGKIGDSRAIPPLVRLLESESLLEREAATEVLETLVSQREDRGDAAIRICIGDFIDKTEEKFIIRKSRGIHDLSHGPDKLFLNLLKLNLMCEGYEVYFTEDATDNCDIEMRGTFEVKTRKKEPMFEWLETALGAGKHIPRFWGYMDMEVTIDYRVGGAVDRKTYNKSLKRKYTATHTEDFPPVLSKIGPPPVLSK